MNLSSSNMHRTFLRFLEAWVDEIVDTIAQDIRDTIPFYYAMPVNDIRESVNAIGRAMLASLAMGDLQHCNDILFHALDRRVKQGLPLDQAMMIPSIVRKNMFRVSFMALKERIGGSEDGLMLIADACDCITNAITQSYHHNLESMVAERTLELTRTNEHLHREIAQCERLHQELQCQTDDLHIFHALIEYAPDGIAITSLANIITSANPAFGTLTGYGAAASGMHINTFYAEAPETLHHATQQAIDSGFWQGELTCRRRDGSTFISHVSLFTVRGAENEPVALARIIRDITQKKHAEEKIRTLNAELERRVDERTTQLAGEIAEHKRTEAALRESEKRYRIISELTSDHIYSMRVVGDGSLKMEWFTESFIRSLGYTLHDLRNLGEQWIHALIHTEDIPKFTQHVERVFAGIIDVCEFRVRNYDGSIRWLRSYAKPDYDDHAQQPTRIYGAQQDITIHKQEDEALRTSEARYRAIVEDQTELICRFLQDGTLTFVNDAYCRYFGLPRETLIGQDVMAFVLEEERELVQRRVATLNQTNPVISYEQRVMTSSGKIHWQHWTDRAIFDEHGDFIEFQAVGRDITERKWAEEQLRYQALHDALTRLPNRMLFLDRLGQAIKRRKNQIAPRFTVFLVDLDNFKMISGSLGHLVGDELLKQIAHRLQACVSSGDTVARSGDDEFAILIEDVNDISEATNLADRIKHVLGRPLDLGDHEIVVSVSIGIAMSAAHYHRPEEMLRDADIAMHRAKLQGRNRSVVFDTTMHTHAVARLQRETELRHGIERQELLLFYQPVVELHSGCMAGFEALARWNHPQRGLVSPVEFIPIAEETGLVIPLGHWVLREACRQMRRWNEHFPQLPLMQMHVNLSPKEFAQPNLKQQIARSLQETGLNPAQLNLEITESVMMNDAECTVTTLKSLRELGVQLSIDDFGTGYSSLRYMQRFPVQLVKIDRSFVSAIARDSASTAIVEAIVMLSHAMGMQIIAEGVSSLEDLAQLESMGCDYGQGFLFSRPLSKEDAETWLAEIAGTRSESQNRGMLTSVLQMEHGKAQAKSAICDE